MNLTIAENIAFGVHKEKIDRNSIQSIIVSVGLKDFILDKKEGLDFIIDDNSGNLSGGQTLTPGRTRKSNGVIRRL